MSYRNDSAYQASFGNLADETVYYDPYNKVEENQNNLKALKNHLFDSHPIYAAQLKAMESTSGGAGTAGYAMSPVYVDPTLVDRTRKFTPVKNMLKRVTNMGRTADFNVITAKGGAFTAAEDSSLSETNTTYDRNSVAIKYLYSVGRVTGQAIAAIPGYNLVGANISGSGVGGDATIGTTFANNALQTEVMVKMRELAELEEKLLINGNATTSVYGGANGTEFNGIVQTQSTTNEVDGTGSEITEALINEAIQEAFDDSGRPDFAICDSATYRDIMAILSEKKILMQNMEVTTYGTVAITWLGMTGAIKIYPSQFLTNTTGSKSIYFLDSSVWEIRVLQDATYEELAKTNDSKKFMIKEYLTLICRAPTFNSKIKALS
ncbi:MAG: hypothetical protein EOL95_09715 [Bacteroidia bacterium]|nr:hypothetical protein [Bacteroidia bacterium]